MSLLHAGVLVLSAYLAAADFACKDEFGVYFQCFSGQVKALLANSSDWEEKKEQALECFVSSGCQKLTLSQDEDVARTSAANKSEIYFKCIGDTIKDMVGAAEKCIAAEVPGFAFGKLPGEVDVGGNVSSNYSYIVMKIVTSADDPSICPGDSRQKVRECLQKISNDSQEWRERHLKEVCAKREDCFTKISEHCKEQFLKTRSMLKKCSCDDVGMDGYKAQIVKCLSGDEDTEKEQEKMVRVLHKVHERYCKRMEKMSTMCDKA